MERYVFYNNVTGDIYSVRTTSSDRAERHCTTNARMNVRILTQK